VYAQFFNERNLMAGKRLGSDKALRKPIKRDTLLRAVAELLGG
jgi:hypothetical protein